MSGVRHLFAVIGFLLLASALGLAALCFADALAGCGGAKVKSATVEGHATLEPDSGTLQGAGGSVTVTFARRRDGGSDAAPGRDQ